MGRLRRPFIIGAIAALALSLSMPACGGADDSPATIGASATVSIAPDVNGSSSATPSVAAEAWDYCDHARSFGGLVRTIRRGDELPDVLVTRIDDLRASLDDYRASGLAPESAGEAIRALDSALGSLELSISDAGTAYPQDAATQLRAKAVSYTALTAALTIGCEP